MAHEQKPDFVFRRNGRVHINRRGASVHSTTDSRGARVSGSNAGYTMFRGSVKGTGYPLHSPVCPSLPLPCITMYHHILTGLYQLHKFTLLDFDVYYVPVCSSLHPAIGCSNVRVIEQKDIISSISSTSCCVLCTIDNSSLE
jgi:hypothetical protein